jgi:uncharacterized membrane protein YfcA
VFAALAGITFFAAIVNGALGYGFSSITVPFALLFFSNRTLNPALVLVEVVLNAYVVWVNRRAIERVWTRVLPIAVGLAPGIVVGTTIVSRVHPGWLRFGTFVILLPLILLQAAGYRRRIYGERAVGLALGVAIGLLYAVTTISGPPLAVMLSNQGFALQDFRAALGIVRIAESTLTAGSYAAAGFLTRDTLGLIRWIVPSVAVGVPIGAWLIRRLDAETFRRVCMSFDAWIVGFGLSTLLRELRIVESAAAFLVLGAVGAIDLLLLYRFFMQRSARL